MSRVTVSLLAAITNFHDSVAGVDISQSSKARKSKIKELATSASGESLLPVPHKADREGRSLGSLFLNKNTNPIHEAPPS